MSYVWTNEWNRYDETINSFYYDTSSNYLELSLEHTISLVCNPDFVDIWGTDCDTYAFEFELCETQTNEIMVALGQITQNGIETILNCPQCGCTNNNPIKLGERNVKAHPSYYYDYY